MSKITIDFETYSKFLIKYGMEKYARHSSTDFFCLALKPEGQRASIWVNPAFELDLPADHGLPLVGLDHLVQELHFADTIEKLYSGHEAPRVLGS